MATMRYIRSAGLILGAVLLTLSWSIPAALAAGPLPDRLQGSFRGSLVGEFGTAAGEFTVSFEPSRGGFTVSWPPDRRILFEPSDRKGIFQAVDNGHAIDGNPVYWARIEGSSLLVYAMQIDSHGGYDVITYLYTPDGDGVSAVVRRLHTGGAMQESKGGLQRYGR